MLRARCPLIALVLLVSSACSADDTDEGASETSETSSETGETTGTEGCAAVLDAEACDARPECFTAESQAVQNLGDDMYCREAEATFLSCEEAASCEGSPYVCMGDSVLFLSYACVGVPGYGDCPAPFDGDGPEGVGLCE